jgi:hypothetical protein
MPAVSRHLKLLEQAALLSRTQSGRVRASHVEPAPLRDAADWKRYRRFWDSSVIRPDAHLAAVQATEHAAEHAAEPAAAGLGDPTHKPRTRISDERRSPHLYHASSMRRGPCLPSPPRALRGRGFTNPDDLANVVGPADNDLPFDKIEFDVRPGDHRGWAELNPVLAAVIVTDP